MDFQGHFHLGPNHAGQVLHNFLGDPVGVTGKPYRVQFDGTEEPPRLRRLDHRRRNRPDGRRARCRVACYDRRLPPVAVPAGHSRPGLLRLVGRQLGGGHVGLDQQAFALQQHANRAAGGQADVSLLLLVPTFGIGKRLRQE